MPLLHQQTRTHADHLNRQTSMNDTESCNEESKLSTSSGQSTQDSSHFLFNRRRRSRTNSFFVSNRLTAMSPQPRKERLRHRRKANSWHGSNKLIHFFHNSNDNERQPAVPPKIVPKVDEEYPLELNSEGNPKECNQVDTDRLRKSTRQQSHENELENKDNHNSEKPMKAIQKKGHMFSHFFKVVENFFSQKHTAAARNVNQHHDKHHTQHKKNNILLYGCETDEDHAKKVKEQTELIRALHGKEGLRAIDLEYRMIPCDAHKVCDECVIDGDTGADSAEIELGASAVDVLDNSPDALISISEPSLTTSRHSSLGSTVSQPSSQSSALDLLDPSSIDIENVGPDPCPCHWCMQRLFHIPTGLVIDEDNRKLFCADGDMYEEVTRLCQEYAQDLMCKEANLEWYTVESTATNCHKESIRMMVSKNHLLLHEYGFDDQSEDKPTLLIATGRGKVRAGIFSRMHMMCSGLESATAIPMIREAAARNIDVIVLDPNVHGDANGYITFSKCMDHYYQKMQNVLHETGLYVLSHSASGGHMTRYLLDKPEVVLSHFRAIAFTDSTHNIQWTRKKPVTSHASRSLFKSLTDEHEEGNASPLQTLLESERCVYFRCAVVRRDGAKWYVHPAGEPAQTDAFWIHRFGKIRTYWAGTDEHSLTNWYSHAKIWEHFDQYLQAKIVGKRTQPTAG